MQGQAAQLDAMRRAQVKPLTWRQVAGWIVGGAAVAGLCVGSLWLTALVG